MNKKKQSKNFFLGYFKRFGNIVSFIIVIKVYV